MKCPYCGNPDTKVIDSRPAEDGSSIRRRRACDICGKRFTTYEKIETIPLIIIKKDNNREQYSRQKIENGIIRACYKRPVPTEKIQQAVDAKADKGGKAPSGDVSDDGDDADELLSAAVEVVLETGQASVSMLQRRLKLGYARAARIMDEMEERGIVGPFEGSKPRQLLITREQWQAIKDGAPISSEPVEEEIP